MISDIEKKDSIVNLDKDLCKMYSLRIGNAKIKVDNERDNALSRFCQIYIPNSSLYNAFNLDSLPEDITKRITINQSEYFN